MLPFVSRVGSLLRVCFLSSASENPCSKSEKQDGIMSFFWSGLKAALMARMTKENLLFYQKPSQNWSKSIKNGSQRLPKRAKMEQKVVQDGVLERRIHTRGPKVAT